MAEPHIEARLVAVLHVKGRRAPVKCYELLAKKGELSEPMREVCRFFAKGYGLHEDGSFAEAMTAFDQALTIAPTDGPSLYYRASCVTQLAKAL